jgi:hypothetical protein
MLASGKVMITRTGGPGEPSTTISLPDAVVELAGPEKSSYRLTDGAGCKRRLKSAAV